MTVKELITRLLDMPMSYDVILADNNIHIINGTGGKYED